MLQFGLLVRQVRVRLPSGRTDSRVLIRSAKLPELEGTREEGEKELSTEPLVAGSVQRRGSPGTGLQVQEGRPGSLQAARITPPPHIWGRGKPAPLPHFPLSSYSFKAVIWNFPWTKSFISISSNLCSNLMRQELWSHVTDEKIKVPAGYITGPRWHS